MFSRGLLGLALLFIVGGQCSTPESPVPPSPTASSSPGLKTYVIPQTIAADCSVDVTQAITDWIASVPDSSVLNFGVHGSAAVQPACYRIDGSIEVPHRNDLVFEGNGSSFQAFEPGPIRLHRDLWLLGAGGVREGGSGGSNLTMRDMTIIGADPTPGTSDFSYEFQHGIWVRSVQDALIENVNIRNVYGDFISIGPHNREPSRDVTIRGGEHRGSGRQGVTVTNGMGVVIEDGSYADIAFSVFDLEPGRNDEIRDITIRGNVIGNHNHLFLAAHGADIPKDNVTVEGNAFVPGTRQGSSNPTITVTGAGRGWVVKGNDFVRYKGRAFQFFGYKDTIVTCNRVRWIELSRNPEVGVEVEGGAALITDNRFVDADGVWTGNGQVVESGNRLDDSRLPASCGE